jgi:hypothetical protein
VQAPTTVRYNWATAVPGDKITYIGDNAWELKYVGNGRKGRWVRVDLNPELEKARKENKEEWGEFEP